MLGKDIYLILYDLITNKSFRKYFDTEYDKEKFKRKLKFSKKIRVLEDSCDNKYME